MSTDIAHTQLLIDRIERLHASARARGMSEAAIARLPKLPQYAKPMELPPVVLATKRNGWDLDAVERSRKAARIRFQLKLLRGF
jgi:hypothetical protein